MRRHAIPALVYSKRDLPTPRKSLEAYVAEYSAIAWFHENFHSLRKFPFGERSSRAKRCVGIHYHPRPFALSFVCFVLELAGGPSNFTLPSSGLKPISFAFHRDLLLRLVEKADVAIFRIDRKKSEIQGFICTAHTPRFVALPGKRMVRQTPKTRPSQFGDSPKYFAEISKK